MSRRVWKFPLLDFLALRTLTVEAAAKVQMPRGAQIVGVAMQDNVMCAWALVDPDQERVTRRFVMRGTGEPVGGDERYVGAPVLVGSFVWHIFEVEASGG